MTEKRSNDYRTDVLIMACMLLMVFVTIPAGYLIGATLQKSSDNPPNIVFILSDDVGYGDIGAYWRQVMGSEPVVDTPHIDRLAESGMMFMDAHTPAALCAPTRYSALTGNYPFRGRQQWGVWLAYQKSNILPSQQTAAHVVKRAGYRTGFFGKWHIGGDWYNEEGEVINRTWGDPEPDIARGYAADGPVDQGFDYSYVLPAGIQHHPYAYFERDKWMKIDNSSEIVHWEEGTYGLSKILTGGVGDSNWNSSRVGPDLAHKAVDFIDRHQRQNSEQPFMMFYSSQGVHVPHTPPETFNGREIRGAGVSRHADMIYELDQQVGAIMEKLKEEGILENTLVIFTSDNGGLNVKETEASGHDSSGGLRGAKGQIYEGGHRVPFIARWGDGTAGGSVIKPGSRSHQTISIQDWVATIYDLTGQAMSGDQALDSISLLPVLTGQQPESRSLRDASLYQQGGGGSNFHLAVRQGKWKLVMSEQEESEELYNLEDDLQETNNLIGDPGHRQKVRELEEVYQQIRHETHRSTPVTDYSVEQNRTISDH